MERIITMRSLLVSKKNSAVLRKLQQLNIGVSMSTRSILGSKWTIGSEEPTLEWVEWVRSHVDHIDRVASLYNFQSWLDKRLTLEMDWTRHFNSSTGAIVL